MSSTTRRQMYAEQTRAALVTAARDLFLSQGFISTSVEAITQAALVSKGTFYHHFTDKKAVFAELYGDQIRQIATISDNAAEVLEGDPEASAAVVVADLTTTLLRRTIDDPLLREMMMLAPSVLGEQYRRVNATVALPSLERLLITLTTRNDLNSDVHIPTVAQLLLASLCEGTQIIACAAASEPAYENTKQALDLLMSGLAAGSSDQNQTPSVRPS